MPHLIRTAHYDSALAEICRHRELEQLDGFTLIASENHPHPHDVAAERDACDAGFAGGYFEGYPPPKPGKSARYYQGCEQADILERLAQQRVVAALAPGMEDVVEANLQAPTGAVANMVAYTGVLQLGDIVVAPSLTRGYGHLSHGPDSPNITGKLYSVSQGGYGVHPETGLIDYDEIERAATNLNPKLIVGGFSSYPREVDWARIARTADSCGAVSMADISHPAGLVVAGLMNNPFAAGIDIVTSTTHKTMGGVKGAVIAYNRERLARKVPGRVAQSGLNQGRFMGIDSAAFPGMLGGPDMCRIAAHASTFRRAREPSFREVQLRTRRNAAALAEDLKSRGWNLATGGTDNHIVLVSDVTKIGGIDPAIADGWEAAKILESIGLVTNKNAVPGVEGTAVRPRGLRLGTAALSTRGLETEHVDEIAHILDAALRSSKEPEKLAHLRKRVRDIARAFPVPAYL